ncbi:PH domain-containing protein [Candidatus Palauibacter sp.]|uniref:PH domain-containing protein n=1 Tax=Candidatus Palauibacter sp. TaxID=3101350 RepID=UPI003B02B37B
MNPPSPGDWQRASPFAIVFFAGNIVRITARVLIPLIATVPLVRDNPGILAVLLPLLWAALLLVPVAATVQWACFRFRIAEDRLLIHKGFLKKSALDLPYERVQGINVRRSPVDRLFELVTVALDTSGTIQAEGKLPSIRTDVAHHLQRSVTALRPGLGGPDADQGGSGGLDAGLDAAATHRGHILLRLGPADMVRIGLANRNFIFVAALVGVLGDLLQPGDLMDPVVEAVEAGVDSAASALTGLGALARVGLAAALIASVAGVALLLMITSAFLRHHNFTLLHDGRRFRSHAGLLTQREVVVEGPKIQQLTVSQDLVLRWFRRYRVRALPAGALLSPEQSQAVAIEVPDVLDVPLLDGRLAEDLRALLFAREARGIPVLPRSKGFKRVSPYYIRALALRYCLSCRPPSSDSSCFWRGPGCLSPAYSYDPLLVGRIDCRPCGLAAWQRWRRQGYVHDSDGLSSRSGFIGSEVKAFLMRKAQSATVKQSPLQRRRDLATLQVQLACGKITVPYLDHRAACALRDYILYKVESSSRRWH